MNLARKLQPGLTEDSTKAVNETETAYFDLHLLYFNVGNVSCTFVNQL
jgi:hypothetical protein